ncbi:MAG: MBOAT family protein [Clostridiales bacterium]|nr:MBOAT family protein [Clostridiales bacterium]
MSFASVSFLFYFLPAALLLYYICPRKIKGFLLVLISLLFYAWGSTATLLVILCSFLFNYVSGLAIGSGRKKSRVSLIFAVIINVAVLVFYKYVLTWFHMEGNVNGIPLGLSFYTFTVLSYLIDVYRGTDGVKAAKNPVRLAQYVFFFPKFISGPIEPYHTMAPQLQSPDVSLSNVRTGAVRFVTGLFKKVLISDVLGTLFSQIQGLPSRSVFLAWLGMLLFTLQLYFDFCGYSDMAIGLAGMLGYKLQENFDEPYASTGISDFWRRWHISLGHWFRDYIYIPMGGNRCSQSRQIMNLMTVWLLTGFWHGASLNFVFWGLYHGVLIILEKFCFDKFTRRWPNFIKTVLTFILVMIGWVFFFSPSLMEAFSYIGELAGTGGQGFFGGLSSYYLSQACLPVIIGLLFCIPLVNKALAYLGKSRYPIVSYILLIISMILLVLCVGQIIGATNVSFLYFNF